MATRRAEALAIVGRVRRVGWQINQLRDGIYRITCPDGYRVEVHSSPSDVHHTDTIWRELNRHGFALAEAQADLDEEARRAERLAEQNAINDRRTAAAVRKANQEAAVTRAAGPYAPPEPTLDEILTKHPAPIVFPRVTVTPEMAKAMLERNTHNRPLRADEVTTRTAAMRSGRFKYTHQGIAFDSDGVLQDGQGRLAGIVQSGTAADLMVSCGWPPDNFAVLDTGRRRTPAVVLGMGGASYASMTAAATRLLYLYEVWGAAMLEHTSDRVDNDVIAERYAKLDVDHLAFAVRSAYRLRQEIGASGAGAAAAFYLISRRMRPKDAEPAVFTKAFVEAFIKGVGQDDDPAIYVTRRTLTRQAAGIVRRYPPAAVMALIVKCWNARIEGTDKTHFKVRGGSAMPDVLVPKGVKE